MQETSARALVVGRDGTLSKIWVAFAVPLFVGTFVYTLIIQATYPQFHQVLWVEGYAALLVTLSAVQAYINDGLAVSWLVVATPVLAISLWFVTRTRGQ